MTEFRMMSDAAYFALQGVYHSSYTSRLLQSPAAFAAGEFQPSAAMDLGSYIHGLMADEFARFSRGPDLSGCTTADGKPTVSTSAKSVQAAIAAWQEANPGAIVLSDADFDRGQRCAANLQSAMAAKGWHPTYREIAVVWTGNVPSVAKFDAIIILADRIIALDYKSHGKPLTNQGLSASAADYCYASQAAHYLDGMASAQADGLLPPLPVEFWIGWTSTVQPFDSWLQRVGDEALVIGAADLAVAQSRWLVGTMTGSWPTAGELGLLDVELKLPRWKTGASEVF